MLASSFCFYCGSTDTFALFYRYSRLLNHLLSTLRISWSGLRAHTAKDYAQDSEQILLMILHNSCSAFWVPALEYESYLARFLNSPHLLKMLIKPAQEFKRILLGILSKPCSAFQTNPSNDSFDIHPAQDSKHILLKIIRQYCPKYWEKVAQNSKELR